jgi:hypothetical protein
VGFQHVAEESKCSPERKPAAPLPEGFCGQFAGRPEKKENPPKRRVEIFDAVEK